jgi:hypothetical protein
MNEQLSAFLNEAKENSHSMGRVSPDRYECSKCTASLIKNDAKSEWAASKTGNFCMGARVNITPKGLVYMKLHPELRALIDCQ